VKENRGFRGTILDIGTGSGCIAIALALNLPGATVTGTDISEGAIALARENSKLNNAVVTFLKADIMNFDATQFIKMDIIVSNPPYVRESEKKHMARNVLDFELIQLFLYPIPILSDIIAQYLKQPAVYLSPEARYILRSMRRWDLNYRI